MKSFYARYKEVVLLATVFIGIIFVGAFPRSTEAYIISVEHGPIYSTLVGTNLYVDNFYGGTVSIIDATTQTLTDTITVGAHPSHSILVGTNLYVMSEQSIAVIDTNTKTLADTIDFSGDELWSEAVVGSKLYVSSLSPLHIFDIDTNTNTVVGTIPAGASPVFLSSIGTNLYASNNSDDTVSVVDTTGDTVTDTVSVGSGPGFSIAVGTKLYVLNANTNTVSIIDTTNDTVSSTVTVGSNPVFATVVGTDLYVSNGGGSTISVIDTNTDAVTDTITVSPGPVYSTLVGTDLYISASGQYVSVVDTNTNTDVSDILTGAFPENLSLANTHFLFFPCYADDNVHIIDTNTREELSLVPPTVETSPTVSSITATSAILGGSLLNLGGQSANTRLVKYGTSDSYGSTVSENGTFDVGGFTQSVSELTPNTLYHYTACATNNVDTGCGADQMFTTADAPNAPTDLAPVAGAGYLNMDITWTASVPTADPITDYFVEVKKHIDTWDQELVDDDISASDPLTDTVNLPEYGDYDIRISAENAVGTSDYATATYSTGPAVVQNISDCAHLQAIDSDPTSGYADTYNIAHSFSCSDIPDFQPLDWTVNSNEVAFSGVFNGGGYTISDLTINQSTNNAGLFADTNNATFENLAIGGSITNTGGSYTGLIAYADNTSVDNITSSLIISGQDYVGGLIGYAEYGYGYTSDLSHNTVTGSVSGSSNDVGGLVGYFHTDYFGSTTTVNSNTVNSNIIGSGEYLGGLIGYAEIGVDTGVTNFTLSNDSYNGIISTGNEYAGGLIGYLIAYGEGPTDPMNITISNDSTAGTISSGGGHGGGLIGDLFIYNEDTDLLTYTLNQDSSSANVTGQGYLGGLIGHLQQYDYDGSVSPYDVGTISQSYATGNMTETDGGYGYEGGLIGYIDISTDGYSGLDELTVSDDYATGNISGSQLVGGLIGYIDDGYPFLVDRTYATGTVTGVGDSTQYGGGLIGFTYYTTIQDSYATGSVTGFSDGSGGFMGGDEDAVVSDSYFDQSSTGQSQCIGTDIGGTINGCASVASSTFKNSSTNPPYTGGVTTWDFNTIWAKHGTKYPDFRFAGNTPDSASDTPPAPPSGGGGGGGSTGGCVPPQAWDAKTLTCKAPVFITTPTVPKTQSSQAPLTTISNILGSGTCPANLIIHDFMKQGDKNGNYSAYNQKKVSEVSILQAHINRILAAQYSQASGPVDGIFGVLTKQGVTRLQTALNQILKPQPLLKIDGIVGPFTRGAINGSCGGMK